MAEMFFRADLCDDFQQPIAVGRDVIDRAGGMGRSN